MILEQLFVFGSWSQGGGVTGLCGRGSTAGEGSGVLRLDELSIERKIQGG